MDTFVDSSWYYFRYLDPHNERRPFERAAQEPWIPVSIYIGGIEHATLHLIYTRFWTKLVRDLGLTGAGEPVRRLFTQGMVIKDGAKMSKSKGNVVDPDDMVARFGADTTRLFAIFAAPPERDLEWNEAGVEGCSRFLGRVWRTFAEVRAELPATGAAAPAELAPAARRLRTKTHRTIERVTDDLGPRMHLNTAVAATMELINECAAAVEAERAAPGAAWALREAFEVLARLLAPFAPHFAEELWAALGHRPFVAGAAWPVADPALLVADEVLVVVQVNGKLRGRLSLPPGASEAVALEAARRDPRVSAHVEGRRLARVVWVPDRLLNLVVA
jgi:leucyl-tRNA synthetase